MKDELPISKLKQRSLDERFKGHPESYQRLQAIADMMEASIAAGCSADQAEERAIEEIRKLGQALMSDWAQKAQQQSLEQAKTDHPEASHHIKKKVTWWTTFGSVEVLEQILRLGRRGVVYRPFCVHRGVSHRGYSSPLQRAVTDFGADESFGAAAAKMREHYRIDVPVGAVRRHTLLHGKKIAALSDKPMGGPSEQLVTQMDGSMIPVMEPGSGNDARKGKQLYWREARLCLARGADRQQACYGATLGSSQVAGWVWQQVAQMAGWTPKSRVHGVGDGAPWIVEKFTDYFGGQGSYLIDFWHVSQYLSAAGEKIARPGKAVAWRHRQQGRLLENKVPQVLRTIRDHCEPEGAEEFPVRAAWTYISERANHLDYAGARKKALPIGSGEVEGGHRHVIQERLKLSGCWWKEINASSMLNLRTARANNLWTQYWTRN